MSDLFSEGLITLAAAGRMFPGARGGAAMSPSAIFRWATTGSRTPDGRVVKLQVLRIGGRLFTSRDAVRRYAEALSAPAPETPADTPVRTPHQKRQSSEAAAKELQRLGA